MRGGDNMKILTDCPNCHKKLLVETSGSTDDGTAQCILCRMPYAYEVEDEYLYLYKIEHYATHKIT